MAPLVKASIGMGCISSNSTGVSDHLNAVSREVPKDRVGAAWTDPHPVASLRRPGSASAVEAAKAAGCWTSVGQAAPETGKDEARPASAARPGSAARPCSAAALGGDLDVALANVFGSGSRPASRGGSRPGSRQGRPWSRGGVPRGMLHLVPQSCGLRPVQSSSEVLNLETGEEFTLPPARHGEESADVVDEIVGMGGHEEDALMQEFVLAAQLLSEEELREFVEEHVKDQLRQIRGLPKEQRAQAFRSLQAEWHPDKCPAIQGLATEIFQRLQSQKSTVL